MTIYEYTPYVTHRDTGFGQSSAAKNPGRPETPRTRLTGRNWSGSGWNLPSERGRSEVGAAVSPIKIPLGSPVVLQPIFFPLGALGRLRAECPLLAHLRPTPRQPTLPISPLKRSFHVLSGLLFFIAVARATSMARATSINRTASS